MDSAATAASIFQPLLLSAFGDRLKVRFEFWDGSAFGPANGSHGTIRIRSKEALVHMIWAPGELGLVRAFVSGGLSVEGDIYKLVQAVEPGTANGAHLSPALACKAVAAAGRLGVLTHRPTPPALEARQRGRLHSKGRDSHAISHHYDVGNEFYRLVLGPSMTYSCARFVAPDDTGDAPANPAVALEDAQAAKHDLICRKLGLAARPGMRLLDVGCGWGSMAIHAADHYGAQVVGVTISTAQAALARKRVAEAGVSELVEIRLQDYRDLRSEQFDAISSIGMFEHVGSAKTAEYFETLRALLPAHGRLLNHAISCQGGSRIGSRSFIGRYVFPDGELLDVGKVVLAMERAGFEVRDVEGLREHYALTLRQWVANLEAQWDSAVALVGESRARVWRLYMAGSAIQFEDGRIGVHQVLGVAPDSTGAVDLPGNRRGYA